MGVVGTVDGWKGGQTEACRVDQEMDGRAREREKDRQRQRQRGGMAVDGWTNRSVWRGPNVWTDWQKKEGWMARRTDSQRGCVGRDGQKDGQGTKEWAEMKGRTE